MVDDLVMADCNALMGGTGEVRSGLLGRNPKFIMTFLMVSCSCAPRTLLLRSAVIEILKWCPLMQWAEAHYNFKQKMFHSLRTTFIITYQSCIIQ